MKWLTQVATGCALVFAPAVAAADPVPVEALLDGTSPYHLAQPFSAFAAPDVKANATQELEGRLRLTSAALSGGFQLYFDPENIAGNPDFRVRELPAFDFAFVQSGAAIVPVERSIAATDHPYFDWVLSPGKAWQDSAGYTRLSIPFALMEKNANCVHNGVLLVRLDQNNKASDALVQIGSETCAYFKFNFWAAFEAEWQDILLAEAAAVLEAYTTETAAIAPRKTWAKLEEDYPELDANIVAQTALIEDVHMSAFGVLLNGTHYAGGCHTRMGTYPHCEQLALPSYSLAKSLAGGLGLMRLKALYPGALDALVAEYVPACSGKQWQGVRFHHLLDMTTGNYDSATPHRDEGAADYVPFFTAATSEEKTKFACEHFKRKSNPGKKWVYHTSDTYLLGVAMNAFLAEKRGEKSEYFEDLLVPLFEELNLSPVTNNMRRTAGENPQPFSGYGMLLHADDTVRLAEALAQDSPVSRSVDAAMLQASLQQTPTERGKNAGSKSLRYQNGFWAWNARKDLGCAEDTWLPFLSGFGGISVVLLPGGNVYYYFSDSHVHSFSAAIKELSKTIPICGEAL